MSKEQVIEVFQYIAKDSSGMEVRGEVKAEDRNKAIAAIREMGYVPTALGRVRTEAVEQKAKRGPKLSMKSKLKAMLLWLSKQLEEFAKSL